MALKQVKNKIIATKKTGQVTKAMEAVSAVKMRKSQEKALQGRPYVRSALRILARLASSRDGLSHPFVTPKTAGKRLVVVVTSDKGLAGSVNSAVLKLVDEITKGEDKLEVIPVGRKAVDYANRMGLTTHGSYINISDDVKISDVANIADSVFSLYKDGQYKSVEVIYQNFISTFEQAPTCRRVLPLDPAELLFVLQSIRPKTGRFSEAEESIDRGTDYLIEPSTEVVLDSLIPQLIEIIIYHSLIESKASEHSARMVAMKNATDKTKEVIKSLTIKYNKERQAAITAEVSEITAGAAAIE
ncbi:ATP synthase F1 subunit gamma [Candidatus Kaiserbacteria bacterium RIFOXYB1_FULL_46_14]|uniref:ATP synthase gamma chain n=1 Tax=Candidatus Kaiserbacteria bacterium RIFOXYB1_FULL_46_14 TaxID=1798531 RepID=A0A1F6FJY7_9BACT|nr:MAG: ATP synthase F1 subunit gamma [Candidatus Kaiserbacteria bacterium RIFOXYB1_FULL_46_14]